MSGIINLIFGNEPPKPKKTRNKSKSKSKSNKPKKKVLTRREKLLREIEVEDRYMDYLNKYFGKSYPDRKLNTRSQKYLDYTWGLGAEHEMQLFHIDRKSEEKGITESRIIFDSQESTCLLTHNTKHAVGKKGTCCKALAAEKGLCYHKHPEIKPLLPKIPVLDDKDLEFLKTVPWEYSGRQFEQCGGHLLKRIPVLMPEIITGNHQNRTIESICDELIFMENKFIELQMKNPYTKQKVNKYGELKQLPYGAISNVRVPKKYTTHLKDYSYRTERYKDYLGSYHITITLPFRNKTSNAKFIKNHQNFGNQVQWIEPLLITAFFSGDPGNCISNKKIVRGSFRIMTTGWGNLAGSDLRGMTKKKGIGRYANVESNWRKYLNFPSTKKLEKCSDSWRVVEPNLLSQPKGILSSNIRTFGFMDDLEKCKKDYCISGSGCECPKVSGLHMKKPYGMEIRIFDHFNSKHLVVLMRVLVYLAENSRTHECTKYVYNNKAWFKMTKIVMEQGWRGIVSLDYIKELNKNLGLKLENKEMKAFGLLKEVVRQLFEKHKDGLYSKIMLRDTYTEPPKLPQINRFSWQIQFNSKYSKKIIEFIKKNYPSKKKISIADFQKKFYQKYEKTKWSHNLIDILYALEAKPHNLLELSLEKGKIKSVWIKDN